MESLPCCASQRHTLTWINTGLPFSFLLVPFLADMGPRRVCPFLCAAQVLQLLWKAQPDASANEPMPYTGKLGMLLGGDAYLQLCDGPDGRVLGVKLKVQEIKKLLNF